MKKSILILLLALMLCFSVGLMTGCMHECKFDQKVATEEYLKSEATCNYKPIYYYSCSCGKKGEASFFSGSAKGHRYTNYTSYTDADCENNASEIASCDNGCGSTKIVEIENSKLGHAFTNYISDDNATCKMDGTKTATCDNGCGLKDVQTEIGSKTEHLFTDYINDNNASCMADATKTASCNHGCGEKDVIVVQGTKKEHKYSDYISNNDATCKEDGTKTSSCIYGCGDGHTVVDYGSKGKHSFVNYTFNNDSTCKKDGTKSAYCEFGCGQKDTITATNSKADHVFVDYVSNGDATCYKKGTKTAYCNFGCGARDTIEDDNLEAGHMYTTYTYNDNATCTSNGTETSMCDYNCGIPYEREKEGTKLDHKFTSYTSNDNATCYSDATSFAYCDYGCGNTDVKYIEGTKEDHVYTDYRYNDDATCTNDGTKTALCDFGCETRDTITAPNTKIDHSFTVYVSNNDATYSSDGTKTAYCDFDCGASDTIIDPGTSGSSKIPVYTSNDQIEIYAYSTPTHANWDGYTNNPEGITDKVFKDIADAGFTGIQALREGYYKTGSSSLNFWHEYAAIDAIKVMELCQKYGLKYMMRDWAFMGSFNIAYSSANNGSLWQTYFDNGGTIESGLTSMFNSASVKNATNNPSYAGHNLWDEPDIPQMKKLIPVVRTYKQLVPHGDPFFNLLPCYATEDQLGGTYPQYIDYYCANIAPLLGYISYDYYPYSVSGGVSKVSPKYLYNFQLVAEKAKANDLEFRLYIQAGHYGGDSRECGGVEDYRHQMYTAMAYGVRYFIYFTYGYGMNDSGLVDSNLNPTQKYYYAKQANSEVHKLEDVMLNFNWQSIMYKNAKNYLPNSAFSYLSGFSDVRTSHPRINDYSVTQDTIVGCFKDGENRDGFMFVNYADPAKKLSDTVSVKFNNANKLLIYELGEKKIVDVPANGVYTFTLSAGAGQFIIPLNI